MNLKELKQLKTIKADMIQSNKIILNNGIEYILQV